MAAMAMAIALFALSILSTVYTNFNIWPDNVDPLICSGFNSKRSVIKMFCTWTPWWLCPSSYYGFLPIFGHRPSTFQSVPPPPVSYRRRDFKQKNLWTKPIYDVGYLALLAVALGSRSSYSKQENGHRWKNALIQEIYFIAVISCKSV